MSTDNSAAIKDVFLGSMAHFRFAFKNGKEAIFLNGKFMTNIPEEIKELDDEIALGHPFITRPTNPDEHRVDTTYVDPMEVIRAQVRAELKAEEAAMRAGKSNIADSASKQGEVVVGNTTSVGEAMSGSTSVDGGGASAGGLQGATGSGAKIVAGPTK